MRGTVGRYSHLGPLGPAVLSFDAMCVVDMAAERRTANNRGRVLTRLGGLQAMSKSMAGSVAQRADALYMESSMQDADATEATLIASQ